MRHVRHRGSMLVVAIGLALASGCGGAPARETAREVQQTPQEKTPQEKPKQAEPPGGGQTSGGQTIEDAVKLCLGDDNVPRTDYPFIANYRCSDGSVPLGGSPARGARARVGNVGAGPDKHIIDL